MIPTFWTWLWMGAKVRRSGLRLLINKWIIIQAAVALLLMNLMIVNPFKFAEKALFPAASILIGMAVAWTSRAATVLQDKSFRRMVISDDRPLEDYLYGYQLSLLIIVAVVIYVSIMAGGGLRFDFGHPDICVNISGFWLYFLLSAAVRECWNVINFSNLLSLLQDKVQQDAQ